MTDLPDSAVEAAADAAADMPADWYCPNRPGVPRSWTGTA